MEHQGSQRDSGKWLRWMDTEEEEKEGKWRRTIQECCIILTSKSENQTDRQQEEPLLNFCKIRSGGITIQANPKTSEISFNEV